MKVSRKVYFLILIIEECAEIIHRTCKAIRFGMDERWKPEHGTNRQMLQDELVDLWAVVSLNVQEGSLDPIGGGNADDVARKRKKVANFFAYSSNGCKTLLPDDAEGFNPPLVYQNWNAG